MNLPRLLTDDGKKIQRIINPMHVSLDLNIVPLSYASIKLSKDEFLPARGLVELFSPYGSVGVFRVRSPQDAYGEEITTAELEHSIAEVGDYLVKEKIDEMMSADSAMKKIFKHYKGSLWKLGTVSALGSDKVAVSVNYVRVLDAMLSILEQKKDCMMDFDFSTSPWTVKIVKKGTVVEAEGRLSRNVASARVSYDDTEMCTRVFYETIDKKGNSEWKSKDANTISKYGVIEKEISVSSDLTKDEINTVVNTYLNEHKKPRVGVSIDGSDLSAITGEKLDKFTIGKMFRLTIPKYNVVIEDIIVHLAWSDLYRMPTEVYIDIGDLEDTVVTFLHNLDSTGSGGGGGGGGKKEEEDKWRRFIADFYKTDATVGAYAKEVDRSNNILKKAGLDINPDGTLIYTEVEGGIGSYIKTLSDNINLKVDKNGIISAINISPEAIDISSKRINLNGYVKATDLTAEYFKSKISNIEQVNVKKLFSQSSVQAGSFYYTQALIPIHQGVWDVKIVSDGANGYKLQKYAYNGGGWEDVGNFSRAISTMSADWNSGDGTVKITAHPQEQTSTFNIPEPTESISSPASFNFYIVANIKGKTVRYHLVTNANGGYTKFEKA